MNAIKDSPVMALTAQVSEIVGCYTLWVMPTSVYIPNTDRCFFIIVVFSFYVRLILCVLLLYACYADYVVCKWRYPPFVTLIFNK